MTFTHSQCLKRVDKKVFICFPVLKFHEQSIIHVKNRHGPDLDKTQKSANTQLLNFETNARLPTIFTRRIIWYLQRFGVGFNKNSSFLNYSFKYSSILCKLRANADTKITKTWQSIICVRAYVRTCIPVCVCVYVCVLLCFLTLCSLIVTVYRQVVGVPTVSCSIRIRRGLWFRQLHTDLQL